MWGTLTSRRRPKTSCRSFYRESNESKKETVSQRSRRRDYQTTCASFHPQPPGDNLALSLSVSLSFSLAVSLFLFFLHHAVIIPYCVVHITSIFNSYFSSFSEQSTSNELSAITDLSSIFFSFSSSRSGWRA